MNNTPNIQVKRLRTIDDVLPLLPLFWEGLDHLNNLLPKERPLDNTTFFRVIIDTVAKGEERGHVCIYQDAADGENIGFTITFASDNPYGPKVAVIFAAYYNRTIQGASRYGLQHIERWAKACGYEELQANSPRFSGSSYAMFETRWGFKRFLVVFTKLLK